MNPDSQKCYDYAPGSQPTNGPPCRVAYLLKQNCTTCHGGDSAAKNLFLDTWVPAPGGGFDFKHLDEHGNQKSVKETMAARGNAPNDLGLEGANAADAGYEFTRSPRTFHLGGEPMKQKVRVDFASKVDLFRSIPRQGRLIVMLGLLIATVIAEPVSAQAYQFHGRIELEQILSDRMLEHQIFSFQRYYKDIKSTTVNVLLLLLGGYDNANGQDQSGNDSFNNGKPNSVNLLLYQVVLNSLAEEIQANCTSTTGLQFNANFRNALNTICQWPSPSAQTEEAMEAYWIALMGYDAPEEEFTAWRDFFMTSSYANQPASVAVSALTFALMYNPNFLLSRGN